MNDRLCAGCGLPLTGMRADARFHGEDCRTRYRHMEAADPLARFTAGLRLVPRQGPITLARAAVARASDRSQGAA